MHACEVTADTIQAYYLLKHSMWDGGISFKHCLFIHCDSQSPCHTVLQDVTGEKTQTEACSHPQEGQAA